MSAPSACFHTTQYDLNPFDRVFRVDVIQFPYYIVRFKHVGEFLRNILHHGFHTTQYDLNLQPPYFQKQHIFWFPYYIVRFKQMAPKGSHNFEKQFPYYIVRFKLAQARRTSTRSSSFHTTQYDLNLSVCAFKILMVSRFPYYIVRFKLFSWVRTCLNRTMVSILHSTI